MYFDGRLSWRDYDSGIAGACFAFDNPGFDEWSFQLKKY
jgi:hypothetical protein